LLQAQDWPVLSAQILILIERIFAAFVSLCWKNSDNPGSWFRRNCLGSFCLPDLFLIRDIRAIRAPLDFLQGDYLCSFVSIRGWQKNSKLSALYHAGFPAVHQ
jgi:hypothetical protein